MLPACITARAVMHCGIANPRWRGKRPGIPDACTTRNITYLARGPCWECLFGMSSITLFVNDWENFSRANNSFKLMFARISYFLNRQQCGWNKNMEIVAIPKKRAILRYRQVSHSWDWVLTYSYRFALPPRNQISKLLQKIHTPILHFRDFSYISRQNVSSDIETAPKDVDSDARAQWFI